MAKKSFQDYFILFFMVVAFTFQIIWLSILCTVNSKRWNKDSSKVLDKRKKLGEGSRDRYTSCPTELLDDPSGLIKYKDFIGNIDKIETYGIKYSVYSPHKNICREQEESIIKYRVVFTILGPILLLTFTLLLVLNHFLIKKKIISIIISGILLILSILLSLNTYNNTFRPLSQIIFDNSDNPHDFRIFYSSFTESYEMVRLLNMLMTIVFSAFYFIYVLK